MNRLRLAIDEGIGCLPVVLLTLAVGVTFAGLPKGPLQIGAAILLGALGGWLAVGNWMMLWRNLVHHEAHSMVPFFGGLLVVPIIALTGQWLGWSDWVCLTVILLIDPGTGAWMVICWPYWIWRRCRG